MPSPTPSEGRSVQEAAYMGRVAERADAIDLLTALLAETDKSRVLEGLRAIKIVGEPLRFGEGFEQKNLPAIHEDIRTAIAEIQAVDKRVPGLATAINRGLVQAAKPTTTEATGSYETQLEVSQVEWVKAQVEAGYERSQAVNAPLLRAEGVPAFPTKEAALKSALKQLKPKQVKFMMAQGRSPFNFRVKISAPSNRLDLVNTLVNKQPHRMDLSGEGQEQSDLKIWDTAERHFLRGRSDSPKAVEWEWSFYQSEQIIKPEQWEDVNDTLENRLAEHKKRRTAAGMKGTDRWDWAAAMADGLEKGRPLDIHFNGDVTNTDQYDVWNFTVVDEEGVCTEDKIRYLVGGHFDPRNRNAYLNVYLAENQDDNARFRAAADGSIEA